MPAKQPKQARIEQKYANIWYTARQMHYCCSGPMNSLTGKELRFATFSLRGRSC
jgi:hypothetical protein